MSSEFPFGGPITPSRFPSIGTKRLSFYLGLIRIIAPALVFRRGLWQKLTDPFPFGGAHEFKREFP